MYRIKTFALPLAFAGMMTVFLMGCHTQEPKPSPEATPSPEVTTTPSASPREEGDSACVPFPEEAEPLAVTDMSEVQKQLYNAICELRQPAQMDISGLTLSERPDLDVKNLYYQLLNREPELKYAYDLSARVEEKLLICEISYMPYKTGDYPAQWQGIPVASLEELVETGAAHLGEEPIPIRLTDTSLGPDNMNRALQQVGGGYILCALNRDGTELTYTPCAGMTVEECLSLLAEAEELARKVTLELATDSMSGRERAEVLYDHLIHTVSYDQRYYSDPENMPYDTRTAIGALRDGTAICGGYSNALKLLFEHSGISCYTATGKCRGESHMWNIALLDGQWLWFDATADRTKSAMYTPRHFALEELGEEYVWDPAQFDGLIDLS